MIILHEPKQNITGHHVAHQRHLALIMLEGALENFLPKKHNFDNTSILLSGKF